jgi:uncharacterized RDD family membrane protein YckC
MAMPVSPTILRRYLSTFIDGMLVLAISIALSFAIKADSTFASSARMAVYILMFLCYEPIFTSRYCTIGQKLTGIRVRTVMTLEKISIPAAFLRIFVKIFLGFISLLTIPITKDRRAVHDFASGTIVIMA